MFILNNLLTKLTIQDIISANNARVAEPFFNTSFNTKSMANFYAINSGFLLIYYHLKKCKNSSIGDNIS